MLVNNIRLKRVYEDVTHSDGIRVLVDRLWPRGISKKDERIDEWHKDVAPSHDLRKWFHRHNNFTTFAMRYRKELKENRETNAALQKLYKLAKDSERVTLVYASKDQNQNNAVVLKQVLDDLVKQ